MWMGFLYTVMDNVFSASGLIIVSKKGMAPFLVVFHCEPYGQVNTINVFQEVLFMFFLLDDKSVSHIPEP